MHSCTVKYCRHRCKYAVVHQTDIDALADDVAAKKENGMSFKKGEQLKMTGFCGCVSILNSQLKYTCLKLLLNIIVCMCREKTEL